MHTHIHTLLEYLDFSPMPIRSENRNSQKRDLMLTRINGFHFRLFVHSHSLVYFFLLYFAMVYLVKICDAQYECWFAVSLPIDLHKYAQSSISSTNMLLTNFLIQIFSYQCALTTLLLYTNFHGNNSI